MSNDIELNADSSGVEKVISAIDRLHASMSKLGSEGGSSLNQLNQRMEMMQAAMTTGFKEMAEAAKKGGTEVVAAQERASAKLLSIEQRRDVELNNLRNKALADYVGWWEKMSAIQERRDTEMNAAQQRAGMEYVASWQKMLAERQAIVERRDIELHAQQTKAANETIAIEQRRDMELHAMRTKAAADAAAQTEKNRVLNTGFNTASPTSQLNTARQAAEYGRQGGDVTARYGSAAAAQANAQGIRTLEEAHRRLQPAANNSAGAVRNHSDAMREAHGLARGLAGSLGGLWLTYGSIVPLLAGAAIAGSLKSIVEVGREVEHQLNFVMALTGTGVNLNQFLAVTDSSLNSIKESSNAMRMLAQNGLNATQSLQVLPGIMDLAIVGEMDVGRAALAATGAVSAFGLSFSEAGRVADIFAKTAATSNTSVLAITESMKQASTVASLFKVTVEETAAMLGLLAKINITGGAAGTSMTNMLTGLYEPTEKGKRALKELGVETQTASGAIKPLTQTLEEMKRALSGFNDSARVDILGSIFTVRGVKSAQLALENLGEFKKKTEEASTAAGFMRGVVTKLENDTTGAFKRMAVEVEQTFFRSFVEAQPYVQQIGLHLADAFKSDGVKSGLSNLSTNVARLTGALVENADAVAMVGAAYLGWSMLGPTVALIKGAAAATAAATVAHNAAAAASAVHATAMAAGAATSATFDVAMKAQAASTTAAAAAATAWGTASMAVLGALGVALVAGAALWLLFRDNTDEADQANTRVSNSLHVVTEQLDKEIERLQKANRLWDEKNGKFKSSSTVDPEELAKAAKVKKDIEDRIRASGGDPVAALGAVGREITQTVNGYTVTSRARGYHELGNALAVATGNYKQLEEAQKRAETVRGPEDEKYKVRQLSEGLGKDFAKTYKRGTETDSEGKFYIEDQKIRAKLMEADKFQQQRIDPKLVLQDPKQETERLEKLAVGHRKLTDEVNALQAARAVKPGRGTGTSENNDALNAELKRLDVMRQLQQIETNSQIADARSRNARGELGDLALINLELAKKLDLHEQEIKTAAAKYDEAKDSKASNRLTKMAEAKGAGQLAEAREKADIKAAGEQREALMARLAESSREYAAQEMKDKGQLLDAFNSDYQAKYGTVIATLKKDSLQSFDAELKEKADKNLEFLAKMEAAGQNDAKAKQSMAAFDAQLADMRQKLADLGNNSGEEAGLMSYFDNATRAAALYASTLPDLQKKQADLQKILSSPEASNANKKGASDQLRKMQSEAQQARLIWVDVSKTIGSELEKAFGRGGKALGGLITASLTFGARQEQVQEAYNASAKTSEDIKKRDLDMTSAQLRGFGDMTGAAAGFFSEQSRGYQALTAVSKVFHMAELAMTVAKLVPLGIAAVLGQGAGDPYTAFGRMAAMAAIVTGLGVAVSAGGKSQGSVTAAEQQARGSGTVFGDTGTMTKSRATGAMERIYKEQSASLSKSLELVEKNTFQGLTISSDMLTSLRSIERSVGGLTNQLLQTPGIVDGSNLGIREGTLKRTPNLTGAGAAVGAGVGLYVGATSGAILGNLGLAIAGPIGLLGGLIVGKIASLWGKTTQTITDSGVKLGGSVRALQAGQGFDQYANVNTTKSSWFGASKKTTPSTQTQALDRDLASQFGLVFVELEKSLKTAAGALGMKATDVSSALDRLTLTTTTASLKGLSGEALTTAIGAMLSKATDEMAAAVFPGMEQFRKVGEGYAQTVMRVATSYQSIDTVLKSLGRAFGTMGLGSIAAREYLVEMSGGLEQFVSQGSYFLENFYTDVERRAALAEQLAPTLTKLGLTTGSSRETFKSLVLSLDLTSKSGADAYAQLMKIAPAFKEMTESVIRERTDLTGQLDELLLTPAQLLAKQRNALDSGNRVMFDQIQLAKQVAEANEKARDSLSEYVDHLKSFGQALREQAKDLLVGDSSTLSMGEKYEESKRQYQSTLTAAKGGDKTAQGALIGKQNEMLSLSRQVNGGDATYMADFNAAVATANEMASWSDRQITTAEAQLNVMKEQAAAHGFTNVLLADINTAMRNMGLMPYSITGMTGYAGAGGVDGLLSELKGMRQELATLRTDQAEQTRAIVTTNVEVTMAAAETQAAEASTIATEYNWKRAKKLGMEID